MNFTVKMDLGGHKVLPPGGTNATLIQVSSTKKTMFEIFPDIQNFLLIFFCL